MPRRTNSAPAGIGTWLGRGGRLADLDQTEEPSERLLRQVMSDVQELIARHEWETAPRRRMAFLLIETLELAEEILQLPETGPYKMPYRQRIGQEIYDVLWNACAVARSTGVDVIEASAEKRRINRTRVWQASEDAAASPEHPSPAGH